MSSDDLFDEVSRHGEMDEHRIGVARKFMETCAASDGDSLLECLADGWLL